MIGALLRVPATAIHRKLIRELRASGFEDLSPPHIAVIQYPGPDGMRPSALAERAAMSKQAMNQLLKTLEGMGYITRSVASDAAGGTVVNFTDRGRAAYQKMADILLDIEREWAEELGEKRFHELKRLLGELWDTPLIR
ncbi:MarR family winged helix-turn-helix transcriptional regulator [Mesorhizobium sp. MSK_1335]|uniref:MarR family winged helix-turn-helix transcriptional regulator n=1 Tax=Mesorhizobium montanum TaxID=3072323 RepID=A0ABU4ZRA1_9HYPH|nr:MarR family winged helix-turn-helix transcriptional regulator [Mesorhizobium sp. MSK_1335]MDX8526917.1 MarR family winged helix-turn-helix transcriptional regulator [Mesorhizobium sp. MSK_1335]